MDGLISSARSCERISSFAKLCGKRRSFPPISGGCTYSTLASRTHPIYCVEVCIPWKMPRSSTRKRTVRKPTAKVMEKERQRAKTGLAYQKPPGRPACCFAVATSSTRPLTNLRRQLAWQSLLIYLLLLGKALPRLPATAMTKSYRLCARWLDTLQVDLEYLNPQARPQPMNPKNTISNGLYIWERNCCIQTSFLLKSGILLPASAANERVLKTPSN